MFEVMKKDRETDLNLSLMENRIKKLQEEQI